MMKNKKFALTFFALFAFAILAGIASAEVNFTNIDGATQETSHNSEVTISFKVLSDSNETNVSLILPELFDNGWSGNPGLFNLVEGEESDLITLTLEVPEFQAPGTYSGVISLSGANGVNGLPIDITVTTTKDLVVDTFTAPTETSSGALKLKNTGNVALNNIIFSTRGNINVTFTPNKINLGAGLSQQISLVISNLAALKFGLNPTTITATENNGNGTEVTTSTFTIKKTFCSEGTVGGNLNIKTLNIDNLGNGNGNEWELLDDIEVEVEIENTGIEDIDDVELVFGFFDDNGNDVSDEFDWSSADEESVDLGKIRDDSEKTHTFKFKVPADFADIGEGEYKLAIKAYSRDLGEDVECIDSGTKLDKDFYESVDIVLEDDDEKFVIIDNIRFDNEQLICGETASGEFTVYNVGDDSQERIRVTMRNEDLSLNQIFEITSDTDVGESETIEFSFLVPKGIDSGKYFIEYISDYDYDNGVYDTRSKDRFTGVLDIISCAGSSGTGGKASIIASLVSDAVPGEEIIVEATITNIGTQESEFRVSALGFQSWADLESISSEVFTLDSGESKDITITLNVDEDASGTQTFTIQTISGGTVDSRDLEVNFPEKGKGFTGFSIEGLTGSGYVWLLVLVNVILIVLIVLVAVRLSRR
ncbi:hypothetical protein CO038_04265 [Candidatus Pacearchaeota archaeon CG_4_9_14_0_2_um_filter_39_13]|nr:putative S-layer protein [Candidatus Pacearchaeota archaeon]OIO44107.1 MAG: hypothetical protein AUJ64_00615 [Candidatus Pacearchaeota archaeon CG1_02_39_14]PJC44397.1 MAG: hypothetical protein CO038_04265 [Candidatus Pacearchaeota archaeon CG_4_9_14_0_2_um_filter_39_13]